MKLIKKILGIAAIIAVTGFIILPMTGCPNPDDGSNNGDGKDKGGGGGGGGTPTVITIKAIEGVTKPATGATPVTAITANDQYTGTVTWNGNPSAFAAETDYTATITLTAEPGYTLQGVTQNFFTVAGATSATNAADSGVITAVFPATGATSEAKYSIELSKDDAHVFPSKDVGYTAAPEAFPVTVNNTGNQPTGALTVALSGTNADSFTLSKNSIDSIDVNGSGSFTVVPNTGLSIATYTATVTVFGDNDITADFDVSFTVNSTEPTYSIKLSQNEAYIFDDAIFGYTAALSAHTVTITNTGNQPTGALTIKLVGADTTSFSLSPATISSIAVDGRETFTIAPRTGLIAKTYAASVVVEGNNNISDSFTVSFTVTVAPTYGITLDKNGTETFADAGFGYGAQTPMTVKVTNSGNQPTGALTAALSGTNADSFELLTASINSIAAGGDGTFTVAPKTGLAIGAYTAKVTVSGGGNITAKNFDVSFTVKALSFTDAPELTLEPDNAKITYTWHASNPAADSYDVYWKAGSGLTAAQIKNGGTKITGATSGGSITGLINSAAYSVVVTANKANYTSIDSAAETSTPVAAVYVIKRSGGNFTATRSGVTVGTAEEIQDVINAIRTNANGSDCLIHFEEGTNVLDIGNDEISFNNTGGTWGLVELSGKINYGTIIIDTPVSAISTMDITNTTRWTFFNKSILTISGGTLQTTSEDSYAVGNDSTGVLTISGGTVQSTDSGDSCAVANYGTLNISGGTLQATGMFGGCGVINYNKLNISGGTVQATCIERWGHAVLSISTDTVNISGGTVSSTGYAIYNQLNGKINISGTAKVTSANTYSGEGTIYLDSYDSTATATRLEITGGTVENTSTTTGNTIRNDSTGAVVISGGTVSKAGSGNWAVYKGGTGALTIGESAVIVGNIYPRTFTTAPMLTLAADNAKITYTWAASNPAADTYDVYWKAGNNLNAADLKATGTKITGASSGGSIIGLTNGTTYSVLVTANKTDYTGIDSLVRTATPVAVPTLTLVADNAKITYTWTASDPAADSYDVYYRAGTWTTAAEVKAGTKITGATSGGVITGLTNGTTYSVIVTANKANYSSMDSAVKTATPILNNFTTSPTLTLAADNQKITYTWTASNPVADSYDVYWKAGNNLNAADVKSGTKITGATSGGSITGLTNGTAYSVLVTANKANYSSIDSAVRTATPILNNFTTSPTLALAADNQKITYTWTASNPVADSYDVYWRSGTWSTAADVKSGTKITGATSGGSITGLTNGTAYSVLVTANKASYASIDSAVQTATPRLDNFTTAPTLTLVADDAKISYTWTASAPTADSYDVYWRSGTWSTAAEVKAGTKITGATSGGIITGLTNETVHSVIVTANKTSYASIDSAVRTATPSNIYIITSTSTSSFTANKGSATIGTAGQSIQNVINDIRADAAGKNATIQFGNGSTTLDIGANSASFNTSIGPWGAVTLIGRITSSYSSSSNGTIYIAGAVSVTSSADIANTAGSNGNAIYNNSTGTLTITGGTVSVTTGYAVSNFTTGAVNISGGTVTATTGRAVSNSSTGKITVSGTASVTTTGTGTAIYILSSGDSTAARLEITSGDVRATANSGTAIYNYSTGAVIISGGNVSATTGRALSNESSGAVTISGGTVSATTGRALGNESSGTVTISGGTVQSTGANGYTVRNSSSGTINITGGTVQTTITSNATINNSAGGAVNISGGTVLATGDSQALYNYNGAITISQPAGATTRITSANTNSGQGTIYNGSGGAGTITMTGGTVENTSTSGNGNTIRSDTSGAVNITGGTVSKSGNNVGYAVYKGGSGTITIDPAVTIVGRKNF